MSPLRVDNVENKVEPSVRRNVEVLTRSDPGLVTGNAVSLLDEPDALLLLAGED